MSDAKPEARPVTSGRPTRARGKDGRSRTDPRKVERARLALKTNGGNVAAAARAADVPRTTVSRWISEGKFNPDEWEHLRKERERSAIELAYEGLEAHLTTLIVPHHKTITTKSGDVHDLGPVDSPQTVRAQVEVIKTLGGLPAKAKDDSERDGQTLKIEMVWPDYTPDGKVVPMRKAS